LRVKTLVTRRLLQLRRSQPQLFSNGSYRPLVVTGVQAAHVVAFERADGDRRLITIVSRTTGANQNAKDIQWWRVTAIRMPENDAENEYICYIGQHRIRVESGTIPAASALEKLPVAVLVN